jgi:hypothetical protein
MPQKHRLPSFHFTAVLATFAATLFAYPAVAACNSPQLGAGQHTITGIHDHGRVIMTDDGITYTATGVDQGWSRGDNVEVCYGVMIDKDRNNEWVAIAPQVQ